MSYEKHLLVTII